MERREFLRRAGLSAAGVALATVTDVGWLSGTGRATVGHDQFGASVQLLAGQSHQDAVLHLEDLAQRELSVVHSRFGWTGHLVSSYSEWVANRGQVPILSWFTRSSGVDITWASIAGGLHDDRIRQEALDVKAAGWPCYFCFHKEPENEPSLGNSTDWKAAHDRVYQIFQEVGTPNVTFVACFMAPTFKGSFGGINSWLPPRYDVLGVDGYNRNIGGNWRSFAKILTPAHDTAVSLGRSLFVIEHGCVEGAPGAKGQWFGDETIVLQGWPEVVGVSYNHEAGHTGIDSGKEYWVDTTVTALAGYQAMAKATLFN